MAEWFRRKSEKIKTLDKREIAEGMWVKCPQCQEVVYRKMLEENHFICTSCTHHFRITSDNYIQLLMDDGKYEEIAGNVQSILGVIKSQFPFTSVVKSWSKPSY